MLIPQVSEEDVRVTPKLRKRRWKEQDSINIPQLPQGTPGFRSWRNTVLQSIREASGRPDDQALVWAKQVEDPMVTDEALENVPDKSKTLSMKLTAALQRVAQGDLGRRITEKVEDGLQMGRSTPGLVLLRMVFKHFS